MIRNENGFSPIEIALVMIVMVAIGVVGFRSFAGQGRPSVQTATQADTKLTSDSVVVDIRSEADLDTAAVQASQSAEVSTADEAQIATEADAL